MTARATTPKPVPTIHLVMIHIGFAIVLLSGIAYIFAPETRAPFFKDLALMGASFLFGKFTNGFGGAKDDSRVK